MCGYPPFSRQANQGDPVSAIASRLVTLNQILTAGGVLLFVFSYFGNSSYPILPARGHLGPPHIGMAVGIGMVLWAFFDQKR
jgi:hypothetical protein